MNLVELLNSLYEFEFYTSAVSDDDVVRKTFDKLLNFAKLISTESEILSEEIKILIERLKPVYKDAMNGRSNIAHNNLKSIIEDYVSKLYIHNLDSDDTSNFNIYMNSNKSLYKGRVLDWTEKIYRKDIFHIPFDKREYVSTQRFSVYGVPCIYLGQSLYCIWEELNRPLFNNLFVSRFEIENKLKVFDIGVNLQDIYLLQKQIHEGKTPQLEEFTKINPNYIENIVEKFVFTSVFKIACSIKVKNKKRKFNSEYVFPQLLMGVILDSKIADGIRYSSVRIDADSYIFANYAFPCIQEDNEVYSKYFKKKMKLTQPVNLGLYEKVHASRNDNSGFPENLYRSYTAINIDDENGTIYQNTDFYDIEKKIAADVNMQLKEFT